MSTMMGLFCRLWRCATPGKRDAPGLAPDKSGVTSRDDLTVITGIGIVTQDRLYKAGIKTFADLARSSPEKVRKILGVTARGAQVETWIKQAAGLAEGR